MAFKSTAMGACNVAMLFILVCTFTAVCQADDVISVICEDVTGTVGEEVTFTCSVTLKCSNCNIRMYKFQYPTIYNDSEICRQVFPLNSCEQRNSFTCRYTPTTAMTEQFRFFVVTTCGKTTTEFTVNITEPQKRVAADSVVCEDVTGTVGEEVTFTCSVSQKRSERCILMNKFLNLESHDSICKQVFPLDSCEQRNSFTCRYTPTTAMTEQFIFFVQTTRGSITTEFTVDITEPKEHVVEPIKPETDTEDPGNITGHGSMIFITTSAAAGCVIFILTSIFCVKRFKRTNPSGFQMKYERGVSAEPTMATLNVHSETK